MNTNSLLRCFFLLFVASIVSAKVSLPVMFQDQMVIQRDETITIWGIAESNEKISVKLATQQVNTVADANGEWEVQMTAMKAGGPYILKVEGNNDIVINDVYLGDVWIFSGQSNMQVSFDYFLKIPTIDEKYNGRFRTDLANCEKDTLVRNYMVATKDSNGETVRNKSENLWFKSSPEYVKECNPIAYYFAREVSAKTGVVTASVRIAWGGQRIEPFYKGGEIYENMLEPWSKLNIKGVIWYQGESNLYKDGDRLGYALKLQLMIRDYRYLWDNAKLPFLIVQLPPATYSSRPFNNEESLSIFLEAQRQALEISYTSMAVASDLGMANGLHQPQKYELSQRLANLAFTNVYGYKDAVAAGPQFKDITIKDDKVIISFDTFGSKLMTTDGQPPKFFEIMAERSSKGFVPAQASIEGNNVIVWNDDVEEPFDVRFAFGERDLMNINLTNSDGVPVAVFWAKAPRQLNHGILEEMKQLNK
jgi:sialate O-acetylesterase